MKNKEIIGHAGRTAVEVRDSRNEQVSNSAAVGILISAFVEEKFRGGKNKTIAELLDSFTEEQLEAVIELIEESDQSEVKFIGVSADYLEEIRQFLSDFKEYIEA